MAKTLLEVKQFLNGVVADDLYRVSLTGSCLQLTRINAPDLILGEFDMADPKVEDEEEAKKKIETASPKAAR